MEDRECFDRMLERIEELVAENVRTNSTLGDERIRANKAENDASRLKMTFETQQKDLNRLERFVESDPTITAMWAEYIKPPAPANPDDIPF